jgi:hypothetical protein
VHGKVFKPTRRHKCKGKDKDQEKFTYDQPLKIKPIRKRRSILWDLPYWQYLSVRHSIDVMHVEKNVCESIIGTLLNMDKTKDSPRHDLKLQNSEGENHLRLLKESHAP